MHTNIPSHSINGRKFQSSRHSHPVPQPQKAAAQRATHVSRAKKASRSSEPSDKDLQQKFFTSPGRQRKEQSTSSSGQQQSKNLIDNVNPYELGRQARRAFDDVWGQLSSITAPTKSYVFDDMLDPSLQLESDPQAASTTVLIAGATGRVGRILIRKLLLRGYKVRALIRKREGIRESTADIEGLPSAVEIVNGDVGELKDCQKAVQGVDKIIFCAAARTAFTGDLNRVEDRGVAQLAAAMQDDLFRRSRSTGFKYSPSAKKEIADFNKVYHQLRWDVTFVGVQGEDGSIQRDAQRTNLAVAEISEGNDLVFTGALLSRGALAEVGAQLNPALPGGEDRLAGTEGITLRIKAEGHTYGCVLRTGVQPDFVLVSCSGSGRPGVDADDFARIIAAKRRGEDHLRASGLGYTVIRPGPLVDEPGGYKALVFDQSDRVGQSVSAADVADICLRALYEPEARNKTFDVCYEYQPDEGLQLYELVASIPSSRGNYLSAALSSLQKNT
eukprot:gene8005-8203_t